MRQLRGFLPWITYPVVAAVFDWRVAALAALAVALVLVVGDRRAEMFGLTAIVLFSGVSVVAFVDPASGLHRYVGALTPAALAVAALISIAVGAPFTLAFAKRVAPPEYWDTPMFMHVNNVLTAVWAASFTVTAAVTAGVLVFHPQAGGLIVLAQVAGFVIPMRICRTYPASVRDRFLAVA
jgi:hypothetical protein